MRGLLAVVGVSVAMFFVAASLGSAVAQAPVVPPGPPLVIVPPVVPPLPQPTPAPVDPDTPKPDDLSEKPAIVVTIGGEVIGSEIVTLPLGRMAVCGIEGIPETPEGQPRPVVQWSYNETPTDVQQRDNGHYFAFSSGMLDGKVYLLTASVSADGGKAPFVASRWFVMGGHGPRPPPEPTPVPPGPEPEPTPVVDGKRTVVIVRESSKDNAALSRLLINLRDGSAATYLKSKGHVLDVLDVDQLKPSDPWQSHISGLTLPAAFYIDFETNTVVFKESLPKNVTADNIIETVKRHGG